MNHHKRRRNPIFVVPAVLLVVCAAGVYLSSLYDRLPLVVCSEISKNATVEYAVAAAAASPAGTFSDEELAHLRCLKNLPAWVQGGPGIMAKEIVNGSLGLTDKTTAHRYHYFYHRYLAPMLRRTCDDPSTPKTIRFLEIGLGCAPGGGMVRRTPGGSALAWRHLFSVEGLRLDLHIMEFDEKCASKWARLHADVAVHTGDASSPADLDRIVNESGSVPFDVIIDDASHLNWHQIATATHMMRHVAPGGVYVIEDIHSACQNWRANMGSHVGALVGGVSDCMGTVSNPTVLRKLVEWQKALAVRKEPFPGVNHIDINLEAAVLGKSLL